MKKIFLLTIILGILAVYACNKTPDEACTSCDGIYSKTITMQVNNEYTTCDSNEHCLMVQFSDTINENAWEPFSQDICGFNFVPGYRYTLSVKRQPNGKDADGNKIYKYCLIRIISSKKVYLK